MIETLPLPQTPQSTVHCKHGCQALAGVTGITGLLCFSQIADANMSSGICRNLADQQYVICL